jgi:predicted protein tyrosine phosphatase
MPRILFVCSQNKLRSPTAEQIFSQWPGVECASAGLHDSAEEPVGGELIDWAEIVFVMEQTHKRRLSERFRRHLKGKRLVCLGILDKYAFMDPALVRLLEAKVGPYLRSRGG